MNILSCEYRSPNPQETLSFHFEINNIVKFELGLSDFMESQKFYKDTALSDSKTYKDLTKGNKGVILFEDNQKSYVMFNNLVNINCFNISIYMVGGESDAFNLSSKLKSHLTGSFDILNVFDGQGCKNSTTMQR